MNFAGIIADRKKWKDGIAEKGVDSARCQLCLTLRHQTPPTMRVAIDAMIRKLTTHGNPG